MQTNLKELILRLRKEGSAVVFSIPFAARRELSLKGGDMVAIRVEKDTMFVRKIDLSHVRKSLDEVAGEGKS